MREALRYLGAGGEDAALRSQVEEALQTLRARLHARRIWRVFPLRRQEGAFALEGAGLSLSGRSAETMLGGCHHAALLVCTLGAEMDGLLLQAQRRDMARAVVLDACANALVEEACDQVEQELAARCAPWYLTDRFSPGYGDLPLTLQPALLAAVDATRRVGVHLTPSLLLTPQKSVTAVIGLADTPQPARVRGCAHCALRGNCAFGGHGGCADGGDARRA